LSVKKKEKKKMKQIENNRLKYLITAILLVSLMLPVVALPLSSGQTVSSTHTWLYVGTGAGSAPMQIGDDILIIAWTKDVVPDIGETAGLVSSPSGRSGWDGMKINVTCPDNSTVILDMPRSDPVGANYVVYTPDQLGTYIIQATFPATWKNATNAAGQLIAQFFSEATSPPATFTVQEDPVPKWNESPVPEDYWTRPISGAARTWYVLASNKLGGAANVWPLGGSGGTINNYAYGKGPETSHVLWTKPFAIGGIMDERLDNINYQTNHYQGTTWSASLVVDGKIYWSPRYTTHGNQGWQGIDLYTGETLFTNYTDRLPAMANVYNYYSPNQQGGFAYLWRTSDVTLPEVITLANVTQKDDMEMVRLSASYTVNRTQTPLQLGTVWEMIDAWSLETVAYVSNPQTAGTQVYGKDGSILYYNLVNKGTDANPRYYMTVWNSSAGTMVASVDGTGYWQWRPSAGHFGASNPYFSSSTAIYNIVHDGRVFYSQNFSLPSSLRSPVNSRVNQSLSIRAIRQDEYAIIGTPGWYDEDGLATGYMMCISLEPGRQGERLWDMKYTPPFASKALNVSAPATYTGGIQLAGVYPEDNVLVWSDPQFCRHWIYDLKTGKLLWETTDEPQFTYYNINQLVYMGQLIAYGQYTGTFISYNITTGEKLWEYCATNIGGESPYGNYPMSIGAVADGKIYAFTSEHHYPHPQFRGPNLRCIDALTGEEVFSTLFFGGGLTVVDGRLLGSNSLDNEIYCFGRGPSATTVSTPQIIPALGSGIMITGSVTDQTDTGRRNTNDKVDFTLKGTPAICDADMSAYMEYLYQAQAYPTNIKGVDVELHAIDPNGNYQSLGTVTCDEKGNFALPFTPDVPGPYQITATFAGSRAYGPSFGTAYLAVGDVAATVAPPSNGSDSAIEQYFIPAIAALAIIIIVVGIVLALLLLKKRP
jgi:hypothetical protein